MLCFINLVNYIDRYTVSGKLVREKDMISRDFFPGVLTEVQQYYDIGDAWGGFIQTSFMITYMVFSPLFGYTGDRQAEKITMRKNRNAFFQVQPQMANGGGNFSLEDRYNRIDVRTEPSFLAVPFNAQHYRHRRSVLRLHFADYHLRHVYG